LKTILISSAVSLAIGFTFGWLIKSASNDLESFSPNIPLQANPIARARPADTGTDPITKRDKPSSEQSPGRPTTVLPNGTAEAPPAEGKEDRAKWMRLIEVLGLDADQSKSLEAAIAEAIPSSGTDEPLDMVFAEAGARLEKSILAMLTPEQSEAFGKLQQRALENRIEVTAQQSYGQELGNLDLSSEQREQALGVLREQARKAETSIPASTRLLLTDSILPVGENGFSPDAIRLLREINTPVDSGNAAFEKLILARKAEIEQKMNAYEGILTPAQIARFRVQLSESSDILDQIRDRN
jgi:hypothetical protein